MALDKEITVLGCVKRGTRPPFAWATICRTYSELRNAGLVEKKGRCHILTKKGSLFLALLE